MRRPEVKEAIIAAVLAERERCAKIADEYADHYFHEHGQNVGTPLMVTRAKSDMAADIASKIRSANPPSIRFIRPETAEKHPELLDKGAVIAGQGLSADGERIIGNGRGAQHP